MSNERALLTGIQRYFRQNYGTSVYQTDSLEFVMNTLYADVGLARPGAFQAPYAVLELFQLRIEGTGGAIDSGRSSPVDRVIAGLLTEVEPDELCVVTFKQDLEVEKALDELATATPGVFAIPDSYRLDNPSVISGSGRGGTFSNTRRQGAAV